MTKDLSTSGGAQTETAGGFSQKGVGTAKAKGQQQFCRHCWWRQWGSCEEAYLIFRNALKLMKMYSVKPKGLLPWRGRIGGCSTQQVPTSQPPSIPHPTVPLHSGSSFSHYQMWVTARGTMPDLMNQRSYPVWRIWTSSVYLRMKRNKLWFLKLNI